MGASAWSHRTSLWPQGGPGGKPNPEPEVDTTTSKDNLIAGKPIIRLGNLSAPTLTVYSPTGKNSGAAIVVRGISPEDACKANYLAIEIRGNLEPEELTWHYSLA